MEIERRFLVEDLPVTELQNALLEEIQQGYTIREPEREMRMRHKDELFFLAGKKGDGLSRDEHEIVIKEQMSDALLPLTGAMELEKARSTFKLDGHQLELDVYHGPLTPLMVLRVEFVTEEQALARSPPGFAGSEVTVDKRFENAQLAKAGKPDNG